MAVQHFGMPLSACPPVDSSLKDRITENNKNIDAQVQQLQTLKQDMGNTPKDDPKYNQEVEQYNTLVEQYNALLNLTKGLVEVYNQSISAFNTCINGS
jgi:hypothetical protein